MAIVDDTSEWRPGSFTKNFSWGPKAVGLRQLHEAVRIGFDGKMEDVPREEFRARVLRAGKIDYIPINFFLFNRRIDQTDFLLADELVFRAVNTEHSATFDKLALLAFNLSFAGRWRGASPYQRRPALWAHYYVKDRVSEQFGWNVRNINADDIEQFVQSDRRYHAQGARKLATNLNYLYSNGRLSEMATGKVERWWVDGLFLALDRIIEDRALDGLKTSEVQFASLLRQSHFHDIAGQRSLEKDLASSHLIVLYVACGGRERFTDDRVREITELKLPDVQWLLANDPRPQGAVHPTNPNILKSIPRSCALLAKYVAGFEIIDADELATFDPEEFVRRRTRSALRELRDKNIQPTMTSEELMRITREK